MENKPMEGSKPLVLVAGATGQVGSNVVKQLLDAGYPVRALVREKEAMIHGAQRQPEFAVGSLEDRDSLSRALVGVHTVVSSANTIIPKGRTMRVSEINAAGYEAFISAAEEAGVRHWIQSSVPVHEMEKSVPELAGKRVVEARLEASPIATTIIRNPAFTDVWLVMAGAAQAQGSDPHATTARPYGFLQMWKGMTGNLVAGAGLMLAPGGKSHGAPFVTVRDVASMMSGVVGKQASYNRIIEAGGPGWVTWGELADMFAERTGRKVRVIPIPAWFAAVGQRILRPVAPSASNILGLLRFVATYQPAVQAPAVVSEFDLPEQTTVQKYLSVNWNTS